MGEYNVVNSNQLCVCAEEAVAKYGLDNLTIYLSKFNPMYHSVTTHKEQCVMKMICAGEEEKVSEGREEGRGFGITVGWRQKNFKNI